MVLALAALLVARPAILTIDTATVLNTFRPEVALGAGIDGHESGTLDQVFRPHNLAAMKSAGLRPLTYRLRTELGIEAWHWNPEGTWSDPVHHQGYFVGNPVPTRRIERCYGYRLPRRGSTIDQANDDGYSRLDDGDDSTFWKSNPYLDEHYTGEPNSKVPQWMMINLGRTQAVDTLRINWAAPYASDFRVEYWTGSDAVYINDNPEGDWKPLVIDDLHSIGGRQEVHFVQRSVRFVRITLLRSSGQSLVPSNDIRDSLGFAIREIALGTKDGHGFHDLIRRGKDKTHQTLMMVSSTDPWHRASDIDRKTEQPGFDAVMATGLTNGLPLLVPVSVLYDNPETAANEIRWLEARRIPLRGIEMGEEPDGQGATPEHYARLYEEVAKGLPQIDVPLGGPCYQTSTTDVEAWPDSQGNRSWSNRFLNHLKSAGQKLGFFSFEWYPWDDTRTNPYPQLRASAGILKGFLDRQRNHGVPTDIPWMITEYGYSAFSGEAEVDLPGGILNADIVGTFLSAGGDVAYLYGYEPNELIEEEPGAWGNLMLLLNDDDGNAKWKLPTYWTAWLMTHLWTMPRGLHRLVRSQIAGYPDLASYAVVRPDGKTAVLLLNRDPKLARDLVLSGSRPTAGTLFSYGPAQFEWHSDRDKGRPTRLLPPAVSDLRAGQHIHLQPYSINVLVVG